jgi:hypothetical protein
VCLRIPARHDPAYFRPDLSDSTSSGNGIHDEGATSIAQMLERNKKITALDLSYNAIGDKGVGHLSKAVQMNGTLESLVSDSQAAPGVAACASSACVWCTCGVLVQ